MPKETNIFGGGITNISSPRLPLPVGGTLSILPVRWSKTNLLIDNPLASSSRVTLEEGREPHEPPKGVKEDEDPKELRVWFGPSSSSKSFLSLHRSVGRAGRTDVGRNKMTMKMVQRSWRIPLQKDRLTLLEVQPQ